MRPLIYAIVLSLPALFAAADERSCKQSVIEQDYGRTISACLDLPHRDRLAMLEKLSTGDFTHYLGTVERPSQAFALLRTKAATGDVSAQYVYGTLYSMVHVRTVERWNDSLGGGLTRDAYNAMIRADAAKWTRKAADQGHNLAMLDVAEYYVRLSHNDKSVDLDVALAYAQKAKDNDSPIADPIIDKIQRRMKELR